jgi:DNA polymerase I
MGATTLSLTKKLNSVVKDVDEIEGGFLIGAGYDGNKGLAYLKFLDPRTNRIYYYYDKSGHRPYCYSRKTPGELLYLKSREDVIDITPEKKLDLLRDEEIWVSKIIVTDPLAIGGATGKKSIRNIEVAHEADIKYYENYLYDLGLHMCTYYNVKGGKIEPVKFSYPQEIAEALRKSLKDAEEEMAKKIEEWAYVLSQPFPHIKKAGLDIEVYSPVGHRIPDPKKAELPVISVALVGDDGRKRIFVLRRDEVPLGEKPMPEGAEVLYYDNEMDLLLDLFDAILDYPIIVTFNGDDFDLPYLYHRAQRIGIPKEAIPIIRAREMSQVKHGIHIDLYRTFSNRSIQGYAFSNRYTEHTLNAISAALLGKGKVELREEISKLTLTELIEYCYTDAMLTLELARFNNELVMKLLLTIARVSKMPLEDTARLSVSNWIKSLLIFEHRRKNALVPRKEELEAKGGASSKAIIKGKKYKGGFVVAPKPGVHFNVVVVDFASLYPSLIKVKNLSYETVRCPHEECKDNVVPETNHWVCKRRRGITSLLIGSLRDIRVNYFKSLSKKASGRDIKEFYNVISQALKVILNASYGVMGFENFALYCLPVAEATAALGRDAIRKTMAKAKEMGVEVVYGDTDSLFLKEPTPEQVKELERWALKELGIELEADKAFRYVALSQRKKNYVGVYGDGTVEVKGLTGKKSHTPDFIKKVFYEVLQILGEVKTEEDFEKAREEIRSRLRQAYLKIKNREVPISELAFHIMISKPTEKYTETTPPHVKAAQLLQRRGKEVKPGDIISYVKTVGGLGVKPVELAKPKEVDVDKYVDYLRSTVEQLLDSLGFEFDEIMGAVKLEDFFW